MICDKNDACREEEHAPNVVHQTPDYGRKRSHFLPQKTAMEFQVRDFIENNQRKCIAHQAIFQLICASFVKALSDDFGDQQDEHFGF